MITKARESVRLSRRQKLVQDKYKRPRARSHEILSKALKRSFKGPFAGGPERARTLFPQQMKSNLTPL